MEREKERMAIREIEALEEQFSLPRLSGSEKQIAWARDIRASRLKKTEEKSVKGYGCFHSFFSAEEQKDAFLRILTCAREHVTARWWIDNRFTEDYDRFTWSAVAPLADISRRKHRAVLRKAHNEKEARRAIEREKAHQPEAGYEGKMILRVYKYHFLDREWHTPEEKEITEKDVGALLQGDIEIPVCGYACIYVSGMSRIVLSNAGAFHLEEL